MNLQPPTTRAFHFSFTGLAEEAAGRVGGPPPALIPPHLYITAGQATGTISVSVLWSVLNVSGKDIGRREPVA